MSTANQPQPFWSIVVPTYNRARYLKAGLTAIVQSTKSSLPVEIIVVDNCSADDSSRDIVAGFAGVRFHRNSSNLGAVGNWNQCVRLASGKWVHILHDDDLIGADFYTDNERVIEGNPTAGLVATSTLCIDEEDKPTDQKPALSPNGAWPEFSNEILIRNLLLAPGVVVRREVYAQVGLFREDLKCVPDWEMWIRIARKYAVLGVEKPNALYRVHAGSISQSPEVSFRFSREVRDLLNELKTPNTNYGFVYVWGGKAVSDGIKQGSRWSACVIAWRVYRLAPGVAGLKWLLKTSLRIMWGTA